MFNLEEQKKKLQELHDKIERMPKCKERLILMLNYVTYCALLRDLFKKEDFPFTGMEFRDTKTYVDNQKYFFSEVNEVMDSLGTVNKLFIKANEINTRYGIDKEIKIDDSINPILGETLVNDFFNTMPDNIKRVYKDVVNGNLCFTNQGESMAYNVDYFNSAKVKGYAKLKSYYTYMAIAHEIGHCYQYRLNTNGNNFNYIKPDVEVASIFMEIVFNYFVDEKIYDKNYGMNCLFRRQTMFADWLKYQSAYLRNSVYLDISDQNELSGLMSYLDMTESEKDMLDINMDEVDEELGVIGVKINTYNLRYTISNLLAIYFVDIYRQDKKEGLRILNDYLMLPPSITLEEKLNMCDLTGSSYKKMIKKISDYGKSKHYI